MAAALPKSLRADWTDAPELKKECHRGKPKAESSIRIANVRMVDMISVTPVRVWVVVPWRESWTPSRRKRIVSARRDVPKVLCAFGALKIIRNEGRCTNDFMH
jgi:hypothetical protein